MSTCPSCGEHGADDAEFCEACGARLVPVPPTALAGVDTGAADGAQPRLCHCGGPISVDGYCEVCGEAAPRERDHLSAAPRPWLAGVTDRGRKHWRNEDALAIDAPGPRVAVLVACDGVSSAPDSDQASAAAAEATRAALAQYMAAAGEDAGGPMAHDARAAIWRERIVAAVAQGNAAVATVEAGQGHEPPSCTLVAAVVDGPAMAIGWVGDSRAYWFPDGGQGELLTTDDSVGQRMIAAGVPRSQAEADPASHAITRWLGIDSPDPEPRLVDMIAPSDGWLLVCSDGLWNYCSQPADLGALLADSIAEGDPLQAAERLTQWAKDAGGHDNITVALARVRAGQESITMAAGAAGKEASNG